MVCSITELSSSKAVTVNGWAVIPRTERTHHIHSLLLNATRAISQQLTPSALQGFWSFKNSPTLLLGKYLFFKVFLSRVSNQDFMLLKRSCCCFKNSISVFNISRFTEIGPNCFPFSYQSDRGVYSDE